MHNKHVLLLLSFVFPVSALRADFYVNARPAIAKTKLFRESATLSGYTFGAGHSWSSIALECGFEHFGSATKNYYGEELRFSGEVHGDSRDRLNVKLEYVMASWLSPTWGRLHADFGVGVAVVETRVASLATNLFSGAPAFEYAFTTSNPLGRIELKANVGHRWWVSLRGEYFEARAAPRDALSEHFGGERLKTWSLTPQLEYHF